MQYQQHTFLSNNQPFTAVDSEFKKSKIEVFPNPSKNSITITGAKFLSYIFNIMGQQIYSFKGDQKIDISSWNNGVYFIKSDNSVVKFIKN